VIVSEGGIWHDRKTREMVIDFDVHFLFSLSLAGIGTLLVFYK
jgi:hypothetical protein